MGNRSGGGKAFPSFRGYKKNRYHGKGKVKGINGWDTHQHWGVQKKQNVHGGEVLHGGGVIGKKGNKAPYVARPETPWRGAFRHKKQQAVI